jgi:hypothetical protein
LLFLSMLSTTGPWTLVSAAHASGKNDDISHLGQI